MVKEHKVKLVDDMSKQVASASCLGIADVERIPSRQLQVIAKSLRGKADIKVMKRSLLRKALEKAGVSEMLDQIASKPAVIMSNLDAFSLFRDIKSLRSRAAAKPGMVAQKDIIVPKGGTGLPPGPAIGDLKNAGIPAKIEKGQIVVIKETVVAKAGDTITSELANALLKLDLKPFELGLEITAIREGGMVFPKDVLDIDLERVTADITRASSNAFSVAYAMNYPLKEVIELRLREAGGQARALALNANWISGDTVGEVLGKAQAQAKSLDVKIGGI